jgi:hypothetical protein
MTWIIRLLVDDENMTKDVYEALESMGLKFDLKYGSSILFYIRIADVMKALETVKSLNARFKRKFDNNIYQRQEKRVL